MTLRQTVRMAARTFRLMAAVIFTILCFVLACFTALVMTDLIVRPRATKAQRIFKVLQRSSFM
jgi:hypothetical protein